MRILVTGGAGYIGSFMVKKLLDSNYEVIVIDNLKRGHKEAIDTRAKFIEGDIRDEGVVDNLFSENTIDTVLHFAGLISVEESEKQPELYHDNNVVGSENLFNSAIKKQVKNFIFSSTAAVYGNPVKIPIPEDHPKNPTSHYGKTKLAVEEILTSLRQKDSSINFACLRYFNAAGAALDGGLGEAHDPETHIIPLAIKAAIEGLEFSLFGSDYNTPDGTCIRDYIHVLDLVEAHILALNFILKNPGEYFYNVGTGVGHSNREVIKTIEQVAGKKINIKVEDKRAGDADRLIADPEKIKNDLNFKPKHSDLNTIVETAWEWHESQIKNQ